MRQETKPNSEKWQFKLKREIAYALVALLGKTLRFKTVNREVLERYHGKEGFIMSSWHGQQLTGFFFFKNCGYYILSSLSKDGDYSSSIMRRFGWKIVRGSTARGAVRGLIELLRVLRNGAGIALTPEGSRGPQFHIEPGCLYLAQKTGAPLIPVAFVYDRKWISKRSWDQFVVPKPFARGVAYFGEPVFIEGEFDDARLELEKERLSEAIHLANQRGEEVLQKWLKGE